MVGTCAVVRAATLPFNRLLVQSRHLDHRSSTGNSLSSGAAGINSGSIDSHRTLRCCASEYQDFAASRRVSFQLAGLLDSPHHHSQQPPDLSLIKARRTITQISSSMQDQSAGVHEGHSRESDPVELLAVSSSVTGPASGRLAEKLEAAGFLVHKLWEQDDQDAFFAKQGLHCKALVPSHGANPELMDRLPKLEIIANFGVGYDAIDVGAAKDRGIRVTNTPDVLTDDVADLAIALLLDVSRRVTLGDRYVRDGKWGESNFPIQRKASGKRVGILGLGRIGEAIAARALAFKMEVAYHSRHEKSGVPYKYHAKLVDLAKASDFLIVACPGGPSTHHIVNREVLDALGPNGCLVNIARGSVVVEKELVKALVGGRLGSAGLDVFENEPQVPEELKKMDNVVLQPHVGSATFETREAMGDLVVANLKAHFAGKDLPTPVV